MGLERRDYALDCWKGPPEHCVGYWRGQRAPAKTGDENPQQPSGMAGRALGGVATDALLGLLVSCCQAETGESKRNAYVVAIELIRRKALRLHDSRREGDHDILVLKSSAGKTLHHVVDLAMSEAQLEEHSLNLLARFAGSEAA